MTGGANPSASFKVGNMKKILIAIWIMLILLLSTNTLWFYYLDKKIDKAIEKQNQINAKTYEELEHQEKVLRLLETDSEIFMRIIISNEFIQGE